MKSALILIIGICLPFILTAQSGKMYPTGKGNEVYVPNGDISFADKLVEFKPGEPALKANHPRRNPNLSIGASDDSKAEKRFSLGCFGELTVKFTDNVLIDIPGPDLFIFEYGKVEESLIVLVSKDGKNWIYVGVVRGGTSNLDINGKVNPGEQFFYVKLIDAGSKCEGKEYDGAEVLAIAALGTAKSEVQVPEKIDERKVKIKKTVTVESDEIIVKVWDSGKEDGDIISLNVNGEWVLKDFEVKKESDEVKVKIKKGENYIVLHAENLGRIEPNTAALRIDDGQMQKTITLNSNMEESEGIKIVR